MTEIEKLKAAYNAARAARDAALATLAAARTMLDATGAALADATKRIEALTLTATEAYRKGYSAGEQRSTVAIVADLRAMSALYSTGLPSALAARYETGEHLPRDAARAARDALDAAISAQPKEQTDD